MKIILILFIVVSNVIAQTYISYNRSIIYHDLLDEIEINDDSSFIEMPQSELDNDLLQLKEKFEFTPTCENINIDYYKNLGWGISNKVEFYFDVPVDSVGKFGILYENKSKLLNSDITNIMGIHFNKQNEKDSGQVFYGSSGDTLYISTTEIKYEPLFILEDKLNIYETFYGKVVRLKKYSSVSFWNQQFENIYEFYTILKTSNGNCFDQLYWFDSNFRLIRREWRTGGYFQIENK